MIGDEIGKDHATILHHKRKAIDYFDTEPEYTVELEAIFSQFPGFETILKDRIQNIDRKSKDINLPLQIEPQKSISRSVKLNEFKVRVIRKCDDLTYFELGQVFNISRGNVEKVRNRKIWKHI